MGDQRSLSSFHSDIGISINFHEDSSLFSFGSLYLHMPLEVSWDVRPPIQMRRGTTAFSTVSTGNSDIPSSCEMQHEPKFKPLQGNPVFF